MGGDGPDNINAASSTGYIPPLWHIFPMSTGGQGVTGLCSACSSLQANAAQLKAMKQVAGTLKLHRAPLDWICRRPRLSWWLATT